MKYKDQDAARERLEQLNAQQAALGPEDRARKLDLKIDKFYVSELKRIDSARERLEQLSAQWAALGPDDRARNPDLENEIFRLVYELFPCRKKEIDEIDIHEDAIDKLYEEDWKKFDPAKGSAYGFFSARIRRRKLDCYREQKPRKKHTVSDTVTMADGNTVSLTENTPAGPDANPETFSEMDDTAWELLRYMLSLPEQLHGRANNPVRHNYFRMFFTNNVADILKSEMLPPVFVKRERDLFTALKLEFLDFFMQEECRKVAEIRRSPLKPYGALVEGRAMKETKLPLPEDVYVSYLDRVEHTKAGLSNVSQYKQFYLDALRQWLRH